MTFLKELLAGLALLGIFAMGALAQGKPASAPAVGPDLPAQSPAAPTSAGAVVIKYDLKVLDKNRDGGVSRKEAAGVPGLAKDFRKLDRNRDGKLDAGELAAHSK